MKRFILSLIFLLPTLIIYSQDNNAPVLNSFSFSPQSANLSDNIKVVFNVSVSDAQNLVEKISVEFSPEKGGGSKSQTYNKIDLQNVTISDEINFGKNPKSGIYNVSIYLEDNKKNKVTLSSSDLIALGFSSTFEIIENTIVDTTPPSLNAFNFSPTQLDLLSKTLAVEYQLQISDDNSGLDEATIEFASLGKGNGKSETIKKLSGLTASLSGTIDFGKNPDVGVWNVSITLKDKSGNQISFSSNELSVKGFPSFLTITETKDVTPPQLTGFSFSPNEIDLASEERTINFVVDASDDVSGIDEVTVEFLTPGNGNSKSETFRKIGSKLVSLSGSVDFGKNPTIGIWNARISLKDGAGNQVVYSSSDLGAKNLPFFLQVKDTKDLIPPELIGFSVSPTKIDLNSSSQLLEYQISVKDNLSGIDQIIISFIPVKGGGNKVERLSKINKTEYEIKGWLDFKNAKEGEWLIEIELSDNQKNSITYKKEDLEKIGFVSSLTVVNTLDNKPPALVYFDFSVSSQSSSDKVLALDYKITVTDDLSGIDEVKIMFEPTDNGSGIFSKFNNLRSPQFDYSGKLELKNPKEGEWTASIYLSDVDKNQITLTTADLNKLGFKSKFTVAVSKQLSILSPAPGQIIELPANVDITWESKGINKVDINLSTDNGATWTKIAGNINAVIKKHNWNVNLTKSCNALLRIVDADDKNVFDEHSFELVQRNVTSITKDENTISEDLLLQNFPNPFNPHTTIPFQIKKESKVIVAVYSMLGEKVAELVNSYKTPGNYSVSFNAENLPSGYYFYRLITENKVQTLKMLLLK